MQRQITSYRNNNSNHQDVIELGEEQASSSLSSKYQKQSHKLETLKSKMVELVDENERLRSENKKIDQLESELSLCKLQLSQTPDQNISKRLRLSAGKDTPVIRQQVINDRLKQLERENLELKRQLVGLTPNANFAKQKCKSCAVISKQKTRQAEYFESKLLKSRHEAATFAQHSKELKAEIVELHCKIEKLCDKYQKQLSKLSERSGMYKSRSERLEKWQRTQMAAFNSDIRIIKKQMEKVDKTVLQTRLLEFVATESE